MPETGSKRGRCIKILALVNLTKALYRDTFIRFGDKSVWVEFSYKNLAVFCYYCGMVGHVERNCGKKRSDSTSGTVRQDQYGDSLRASPISKSFNKVTVNQGESIRSLVGRDRLPDTSGTPQEGRRVTGDSSADEQSQVRAGRGMNGQGQLQSNTGKGNDGEHQGTNQSH